MRYRLFGNSGLRVSDLFLGAMIFGDTRGWGADHAEARRIFDAYAEAGGNVVDTAVNYAGGESEKVVADLLAGTDRDRFVLATKYTLTTDPSDPNASGNHRKNLVRSLERSLDRLRTDRVDIYWVHIWDPQCPVEETMRALDDLVRAGKVLYVGISDAPAWVVSRANMLAELRGWTSFAGIQVPYSLLNRDVERELLPMAEYLGLSVAAWSPLSGGALSGKLTRDTADGRATRVSTLTEQQAAVARTVDGVADELGVTSAQVALAWTMARWPDVHPMVGARHLDQMQDNLGAVGLQLPDEAVSRLDAAAPIELGFPMDFLRNTTGLVYGAAGQRVEGSRRRVLRHT